MSADEALSAIENGITLGIHGRHLESWSTSEQSVEDFMFGWGEPWIMISAPVSSFQIFIDLRTFDKMARPFTRMKSQEEVIVKLGGSRFYPASQVSVVDYVRDLIS